MFSWGYYKAWRVKTRLCKTLSCWEYNQVTPQKLKVVRNANSCQKVIAPHIKSCQKVTLPSNVSLSRNVRADVL